MNPTHFLLRIGDGNHFKNSSSKSIWGINSDAPCGKWFINTAKEGDLLWFVKGKSNGQIVAVATFKGIKARSIGPLITISLTNEELGWTETDGAWDTEIYYSGLYNLTQCNLFSEIKGARPIRLYNDKCIVNLPMEYTHIVRYSKITNQM
jgi:hypothetical protein